MVLSTRGHACVLSRFSCVQLFVTLWTIAHQAPLSMGFSRQEYWSGLPCPSPGDLPNPEIEHLSLMSPALAGGFFSTSATWEALNHSLLLLLLLIRFSRVRLCDPMDYSPPGFSVHGIFQARILQWVAISFSRRSSRPRD